MVLDGVVAQLVEHHNGIVGVIGSNPFGSTILPFQSLTFLFPHPFAPNPSTLNFPRHTFPFQATP